MCGNYGIAPVVAAGMLAVMGICDFFGTIGSDWLSERIDNRKLLFWYFGLRGLSLMYLVGNARSSRLSQLTLRKQGSDIKNPENAL
jgi:predicted MFS family arabinose efflux permease